MKLRTKLTLAFLACGLIPLLIMGVTSYNNSNSGFTGLSDQGSAALDEKIKDQLGLVRDIKKSQTEYYFNTIEKQIKTFSENRAIINATRSFREKFRNYQSERKIEDESIAKMRNELKTYYVKEFNEEFKSQNAGSESDALTWLAALDNEAIVLQHAYIFANENPLGSKHELDAFEDGTEYSALHKDVHPMIRGFLEEFGYYDIFLIDPDSGDIIYSVYKELDYATSLIDGPFASTNFGECYRKALKSNSKDSVVLNDYEQYPPSYEAPASFIASPVFDGDEKVGIAIFQVPIDYINSMMAIRTGMGESGETYVVGLDKKMRCDSALDPENRSIAASFRNPEKGSVDTEAVELALKGESGTMLTSNYSGTAVLTSYSPVEFLGVRWALIAESSQDEIFSAVAEMKTMAHDINASTMYWTVGLLLCSTIAVAGVGFFLSNRIAKPIALCANFARGIATGDFLDKKIDHTAKDETGELADSFREVGDVLRGLNEELEGIVSAAKRGDLLHRGGEENFSGCYGEIINGMNQAFEAFAAPTAETVAVMEKLADGNLTSRMSDDYHGEFAKISRSVNQAMDNLGNTINQVAATEKAVSGGAVKVHASSQSIAEGATEQASSLEEVASSLEEMTSMTRQSADNANQAKLLADETRQTAENGNSAMGQMAEAIDRIKASSDEQAKIVKTIDEIAFQTNLLALNAAVEAARAGEAGKGFAVVAEEVRSLAQRSAEAARTTSTMIEESVANSESGVKIAEDVSDVLSNIRTSAQKTNDLVAEIAAASNEQAQGIDQVNSAVTQLDQATQQAADTSQDSATAAEDLTKQVVELSRLVAGFTLSDSDSSDVQQAENVAETLEEIHSSLESVRTEVPSAPKPVAVSSNGSDLIPFEDDEGSDEF